MLELKHICKKYDNHIILDDISIQFPSRGMIGIQGESGCGKSSLLYIIGMLDDQFSGEIYNNEIKVDDKESFIKENISYMMQNKDDVISMTVKENIILPCLVSQQKYSRYQLKKVVKQLGIEDFLYVHPDQLSGGQRKRVSIAKALVKQSSIILCDEPTGALNYQQAHEVMKLLKTVSKNALVIIVSHDSFMLEEYCDDVLTLENGKLKGHISASYHEINNHHVHKIQSLLIYPLRQLFYQRKKLVCLFLFQWIMIFSFFTLVTAMNGIFEAIKESETHSVDAHMISIENKEKTPFVKCPSIHNCFVDYEYDLTQLHLYNAHQEMNTLIQFIPHQTNHIILKQGRLPQYHNEILISQSLYQSLKDKNIIEVNFLEFSMSMKIVGVLNPTLFQNEEIYCHSTFKQDIPFLKNRYSCLVETPSSQFKLIYQQLSRSYQAYSQVLERTEQYQSLLSLAKGVACVFIGVTLIVSLMMIAIVESILFEERKHDTAYLLSLGLSKKGLFLLSLLESFILGTIIVIGGQVLFSMFYYFMNEIYRLKNLYYFQLQLPMIWYSTYDLYIFVAFVYILIVDLGALLPIRKMLKVNQIDILREE